MATSLYLDTARLGQMFPSAQLAHIDFARLAGEEAGSLYFDDFLRRGLAAWPAGPQQRFPGLAGWQGVGHLKAGLTRLAGAREDAQVLLANRTSQLMRLAARLFFGPCRNVFVTDLSWPSYHRILARQARRSGNRLTRLSARDALLHGRLSAAEFIDRVATVFHQRQCDGLFLPAVDNCGIRLPIEELIEEIRRRAELRFVVIDGAQALGHVPVNLAGGFCDLFIAGCHKWLRGYLPMGLGFYDHCRSRGYIEATLKHLTASGRLDDPLLAFSEELQHGQPYPFGETVNLTSLFSCQGAVDDLLNAPQDLETSLSRRLSNAAELVELVTSTGWTVLRPQPAFRSGITLVQSRDDHVRALEPDALRRRFLQSGVAVTTYPQGKVRLSLPERPWQPAELDRLAFTFGSLGHIASHSKGADDHAPPLHSTASLAPACHP